MEVLVDVVAEDLESSSAPQRALSAYFTMVCMGKSGRPQAVPPYTPETEEEIAYYEAAQKRIAAKKK
jgi:acyl-CoA hydrolase